MRKIAYESCVLIKSIFAAVAPLQKPHWTLVAFDMSQLRVMGFADCVRRIEKYALLGGPMLLTRRAALAGVSGGLALLKVAPAWTEAAYPNRTIKMIVPYPAGGTTDFLGRMAADQLHTGLGASVVVENKPGASTSTGAEWVARAEPDGYTLLMATSTTLPIPTTLHTKLPPYPVT